MNVILRVLVSILMGTSGLPAATVDETASIDLLVAEIESMHLSSRSFLATLPALQGPGSPSIQVVLREDRLSEIVDDMLIEWDILRWMECSYNYAGSFLITATYYYDAEEMLVLCVSSWEERGEIEPLCTDRFYYSGDQLLACSYDGFPLSVPSGADRDRGYARLEHAEDILTEIAGLRLTAPAMFEERFDFVYSNGDN